MVSIESLSFRLREYFCRLNGERARALQSSITCFIHLVYSQGNTQEKTLYNCFIVLYCPGISHRKWHFGCIEKQKFLVHVYLLCLSNFTQNNKTPSNAALPFQFFIENIFKLFITRNSILHTRDVKQSIFQ